MSRWSSLPLWSQLWWLRPPRNFEVTSNVFWKKVQETWITDRVFYGNSGRKNLYSVAWELRNWDGRFRYHLQVFEFCRGSWQRLLLNSWKVSRSHLLKGSRSSLRTGDWWPRDLRLRNIIKKGGSAVDTAIATGLCNGIMNFQSMGIGGGHFMLIYLKQVAEFKPLSDHRSLCKSYHCFQVKEQVLRNQCSWESAT